MSVILGRLSGAFLLNCELFVLTLLFALPLAGPYTVTVEPLRGGARQTLTQDDLPGDCLPLTGPNAKYTVAADLQREDGAVYHAQYVLIFLMTLILGLAFSASHRLTVDVTPTISWISCTYT